MCHHSCIISLLYQQKAIQTNIIYTLDVIVSVLLYILGKNVDLKSRIAQSV
jgi:hypothetical protein